MGRGVQGFSGSALRRARHARHLTIDDLAADVGVSDATVRRWETGIGSTAPSAHNLRALAEALQVSIEDLLPRRVAPDPTLRDLRHLVALTMVEVAQRSGISRSSIERLEQGGSHLNEDYRTRLAHTYEVSEEELERAADRSASLRAARATARKLARETGT